MYKQSDLRFDMDIHGKITYSDAEGEQLCSYLMSMLDDQFRQKSIPAVPQRDTYKSGGLFNASVVPIIIVHNTDPSCFFYDVAVIINNSTLSFALAGESAEDKKSRQRDKLINSGHGLLAKAIVPNELKLDQEIDWIYSVVGCFDDDIQ